MQISITKDVNLDQLNSYYRLLKEASDVDAKVDVLLPKTLDNYFVGLVPSILQFLLTWIRYRDPGKLMLDIAKPEKENFDQILENELLFPAFILAWHKVEFFNNSGEINIRNFLVIPLKSIRNSMVKARPLKGNKLFFISIDHFPFLNGGIPAFESQEGFIDNEANTMRNLKPGLESILSYSIEAKKEFGVYGGDLIKIVHELFKNTYEWARTDFNNVAINPSIRGLLIKFYKKRRDTLLHEYSTHKGLKEYFESNVHLENTQSELYFLEISVFDSGIGFVEKYNSHDKKQLSDIEIIKRCLMRHMTSAKGLDKDEKGIGLDRILQVLDKKGFIRIKTNKRCIYRNMINQPYKKVSYEKDLDLFDWNTFSLTNYSEFPEAEGACLTIIYPLATNIHL